MYTCYNIYKWGMIIMTMKDKDLVKLLVSSGWKIARIRGSHHSLIKDGEIIVVPVHGKDMKPGLLNAILKQAKLKQE